MLGAPFLKSMHFSSHPHIPGNKNSCCCTLTCVKGSQSLSWFHTKSECFLNLIRSFGHFCSSAFIYKKRIVHFLAGDNTLKHSQQLNSLISSWDLGINYKAYFFIFNFIMFNCHNLTQLKYFIIIYKLS